MAASRIGMTGFVPPDVRFLEAVRASLQRRRGAL